MGYLSYDYRKNTYLFLGLNSPFLVKGLLLLKLELHFYIYHDSFEATTHDIQSWAENSLIKKNTSLFEEKQRRVFADDSNKTGRTETEST
ncbi:hypothetical protein MHL86_11755 [Brevibacillus laterosporus]|nr:hypothetical protein [Brevibacillus laterosporus]